MTLFPLSRLKVRVSAFRESFRMAIPVVLTLLLSASLPLLTQGSADVPRSLQTGFQDPATLAMVAIVDLHHGILFWLVTIAIVVLGLFAAELYFYYHREQEESMLQTWQRLSFTDNHFFENVFTLAPLLITGFITYPSLSLLYGMDEDTQTAEVALGVKVIGRQWYWSYEVDELEPSLEKPEPQTTHSEAFFGNLMTFFYERHARVSQSFNQSLEHLSQGQRADVHALMHMDMLHRFLQSRLGTADMAELRASFRWALDAMLTPANGQRTRLGNLVLRLLDCQELVLPLKENIQFLVTSDDVIHSFAIPSAGVKIDALPGRINTVVCAFFRSALMYGQCSELCGQGHGFMPISLLILLEAYSAYTGAEMAKFMVHVVERYKAAYRFPADVDEGDIHLHGDHGQLSELGAAL